MWTRVIAVLIDDADLEVLFIDRAAVRAYQHGSGAQKEPARKLSGARVEE